MGSRLGFWLGLLLLCGVHLALVGYQMSWRALRAGVPLLIGAYGLAWEEATHAVDALARWGVPWDFDFSDQAGRLSGWVHGMGGFLFVLAARVAPLLGSNVGQGIAATVALAQLSIPCLAVAAARGFGLGRAATLWTVALWSCLWCFDAVVHYAVFAGHLAWPLAACGVVVGLGTSSAGDGRGALLSVACRGVLAAALVLVSAPALVPLLLLGLAAAWWRPRSQAAVAGAGAGAAGRQRLVAVAALGVLVPVAVLALLARGLPRPWALGDGTMPGELGATPLSFFTDYLDLRPRASWSPGVSRTAVRWLCLGGAVFGLRRWGWDDPRARALSSVILVALVLAYLGPVVAAGAPFELHLFVPAVGFAAALPAAVALSEATAPSALRRLSQPEWAALLLVLLPVVPRLARTALYYLPEGLPERAIRMEADTYVSALVGLDDPMPGWQRRSTLRRAHEPVVRWLAEHPQDGQGRWLIRDPDLAGLLASRGTLQVLGVPVRRGATESAASLFVQHLSGDLPDRALQGYLERYAVSVAVLSGARCALDRRPDLFQRAVELGDYRLLRVRRPAPFVAAGQAESVRASFGSLQVDGARGPVLVLRYHHWQSLACKPGCTVRPFDDGSGWPALLRVDNPPASFEIFNDHGL